MPNHLQARFTSVPHLAHYLEEDLGAVVLDKVNDEIVTAEKDGQQYRISVRGDVRHVRIS